MIHITIVRNSLDQSIREFVVEGHAEYAQTGKDIVCAGVSAVTLGTVNAVEALLDVQLQHEVKKGLMHVVVPDGKSAEQREKIQLLLESMVVMLQSIEQTYGKYILIQQKSR